MNNTLPIIRSIEKRIDRLDGHDCDHQNCTYCWQLAQEKKKLNKIRSNNV